MKAVRRSGHQIGRLRSSGHQHVPKYQQRLAGGLVILSCEGQVDTGGNIGHGCQAAGRWAGEQIKLCERSLVCWQLRW